MLNDIKNRKGANRYEAKKITSIMNMHMIEEQHAINYIKVEIVHKASAS